jgi:hypothetical protein
LKKLKLNIETITILTDEQGALVNGATTNICWAVSGYITGKIIDKMIETATQPSDAPAYSNATNCTRNQLC